MKALSEFAGHILTKGIKAKETLSSEGKSEEEVSTALGETFKFKDNRLKLFIAAIDVAAANLENLYRVKVYSFEEGETIPENAVKVEDSYFVAEFFTGPKPAKPVVSKKDLKSGGKKDRPRSPRPSPWGASPEEIAEKKAASLRAAAAKAGTASQ
jgi:hypothetical protein